MNSSIGIEHILMVCHILVECNHLIQTRKELFTRRDVVESHLFWHFKNNVQFYVAQLFTDLKAYEFSMLFLI